MMRLIGAKEFLKTVKSGTLFIRYWATKKDCKEIIRDFEKGEDILKKYLGEYHIFGDNSGSLTFLEYDDPDIVTISGKEYTCLFHYDCNIVGDASPSETIYLVFDNEDEWPDKIKIEDSDEKFLKKSELLKIRDWFIAENTFSNDPWGLNFLEEHYKDDEIVNYKKSLGGKK